ncbi:hypothetical protein SmJEL517_g01412 [Synchytrium microbalum]|uniref:Transmembrane protein 14C n=1 Tax=Synchytrium microbalum TaxID=1806994 RepID=A0A507C9X5_9FUNG|nr:uncharacterized protein SmJEL517_g01412 [Synchytrium microbalum]TPX36148.1 hypothetical protein SmJEL517_g01412 [Synchytrium microbalum]
MSNSPSGVGIVNPNETKTETAAGAVSTVSSHVDPFPHYLVGGLCGASGMYAYSALNQPRTGAIAGGLALAFIYSGMQLARGHEMHGYDVGTLASAALLGASLPRAYKHRETFSMLMSALGGVSFVGNANKAYQVRTRKPKDLYTVKF